MGHLRAAPAIVGLTAAIAAVHQVSPPLRFVSVAACAYDNYSVTFQVCTKNQRGKNLLSTRFACSITVAVRSRTSVQMQWHYDGVPLTPFHQSFPPGRSTQALELDSGQPDGPLPGGSYRCTFAAGKSAVAASFTSSGPTGTVVDITVCNAAFVFHDNGFPVCKHDESTIPFAAPASLVCEGLFPNSTGTAEIELVDPNGVDRAPPNSTRIDGPIEQIDTTVPGPFAPGQYTCKFALDGQIVAQKTFQLA